ncbi:hypothetical protein Misp01_01380 [Microtetraspora sp. NBRC 13810]|uniref:WXG100 family type VII secretion target n=1 Tax=Microtetraspora sp. NBRC 13810 TaxID=3030990 RepID=UPI00249FE675|nr:WXG100 family type VII secretion target [Microtetraspora sp. NBRC 13810]GLW05008.1 hypothetical protein Misp01_01380 [Microtetraspora sp. NBRC 13810]
MSSDERVLVIRDPSDQPQPGDGGATREQIEQWVNSTAPYMVQDAGFAYMHATQKINDLCDGLMAQASALSEFWDGDAATETQQVLRMLHATGTELSGKMDMMSSALGRHAQSLFQAGNDLATAEDDEGARRVFRDLNDKITEVYQLYVPQTVSYVLPKPLPQESYDYRTAQGPNGNDFYGGDRPTFATTSYEGGGSSPWPSGSDGAGSGAGSGGTGSGAGPGANGPGSAGSDASGTQDPGGSRPDGPGSGGPGADGGTDAPGSGGPGADGAQNGSDQPLPGGQDQPGTGGDSGDPGTGQDGGTAPAVIGGAEPDAPASPGDPWRTEVASVPATISAAPALPAPAPSLPATGGGPALNGQSFGAPGVLWGGGGPNSVPGAPNGGGTGVPTATGGPNGASGGVAAAAAMERAAAGGSMMSPLLHPGGSAGEAEEQQERRTWLNEDRGTWKPGQTGSPSVIR